MFQPAGTMTEKAQFLGPLEWHPLEDGTHSMPLLLEPMRWIDRMRERCFLR